MTLVMGVDSSTQSCKVVVTDAATGAVVRSGRASHPDGTEVDPAAWWSALQEAIATPAGLDDVAAWAIGGQQHGMVALDAEGRVIRPALLWNDTRSAGAAADLIAEFGAEALAQRTGPRARGILHDHEAALAARPRARERGTRRRRRAAARLADVAPARLRSRRRVAPRSGPRRARDGPIGCLGHRLLEPRHRRLRPSNCSSRRSATTRCCRACSARTNGSRTKPVAASDRARATTPAPRSDSGRGPGDVVVSIGTSGTVFAVSEERTIDPTGTVAGFADADGRFLPLVATLNAARVLDAIARVLGVDHAELSRLALAAEPGAAGLALVPYFEGERTPNLPDATASLTGMTLASTTRENLARAAVEGMLSGLGAGLEALRALGVPLQRALLIGGGAQSEAVRAIAPLVLGMPVEVPEPGEYVALGAARQAARIAAA